MPIAPHPRRAEAERLLSQGKSAAEVAATTGASRRAVQQWAKRLGLPRRGRGEGAAAQILVQEVIARLLDGEQPARIARDLEITAARVRQIRADNPLVTDGDEK